MPAPIEQQKSAFIWNFFWSNLIIATVFALVQGWIIYKVTMFLTKFNKITYDHALTALLSAKLFSIPIDTCLWLLALWKLGSTTPPFDFPFGMKMPIPTHHISQLTFWTLVILSMANHLYFVWLAAGRILSASSWKQYVITAICI
jgi:hypothetical protein